MNKKQTKAKTSDKKAAKKRSVKKPSDSAKVREQIAGIVKSEAKEITEAVMDQAMHGEVAPAKFLFEMAGVYPASTDDDAVSKEEDSLAKTLLDRLNIPDSPVVADQNSEDQELPSETAKTADARRDTPEQSADENKLTGQ